MDCFFDGKFELAAFFAWWPRAAGLSLTLPSSKSVKSFFSWIHATVLVPCPSIMDSLCPLCSHCARRWAIICAIFRKWNAMQDSTPSRHFCGVFDFSVRYWKDGRDDPARNSAKDEFDNRNAQDVALLHHETDDVSVLLSCAKVVEVQIAL